MSSGKIAELNDNLRKTGVGGKMLITAGVNALGKDFIHRAVKAVQTFDDFTEDNDPHKEHDFGAFKLDSHKLFWKIDYYNKSLTHGPENPSDPSETTRVLTIMLAEEY